ncbi:MAG: hypothetical protein II797_00695, partial [Clostridia bacterium]|nr:hypothetical protein [Clostridia bacterium]
MKTFKRSLSLAIALTMVLLTLLTACGPNQPSTPQSTSPQSSPATQGSDPATEAPGTTEPETEPVTTEDPHRDNGLPELKFDGETFKFLGYQSYSSFPGRDTRNRDLIYLEDVATNSINEAVRDRNDYVADTYDVNITADFSLSSLDEAIGLADRGDLCLANIFTASIYHLGTLVNRFALRDFNSEMGEYLDLTAECWNQNIQKNLSFAHHLYALAGDLITSDKEAIWNVTFNRDIVNDNHLGNLYDMVDEGTWTIDEMYRLAQAVCDYSTHEADDWFGTTWGMLSASY